MKTLRSPLILSLGFLVIFLGACGGGGKGKVNPHSGPHKLNTKFLHLEKPGFFEDNITAGVQSEVYEVDSSEGPVFDPVTGILGLTAPARQYSVGDVLLFGQPPDRKALKISSVNDPNTFLCQPAQLTDVFTPGQLSFKICPDFSTAQSLRSAGGDGGRVGDGNLIDLDDLPLFDLEFDGNGRIIPGQSTLMGGSYADYAWAVTNLDSNNLQNGYLRAKIVKGELSLVPTVTQTFDSVSGEGFVRMDALVIYSLTVQVEASAQAGFEYTLPLLPPIHLVVPAPIPLDASLEIPMTFKMSADLKAQGEMHYESKYSYSFKTDFDLNGATFGAKQDRVSVDKGVDMTWNGRLTATLYARPTVAVTVAGLIGPNVWLKPYITADLQMPWLPDQDELFMGIEGGCGISVLWMRFFSGDLLHFSPLSWDLFGPKGGGGGNSAPVCQSSSVTVPQGTSPLQLSATDPDGDQVFYTLLSQPAHGHLRALDSLTGRVEYTPEWGYSGRDSFLFTAHDGVDTGNPALVSITVDSTGGHPPVAQFSWTTPGSYEIGFDASASSDQEDPLSALEVRWDFQNDGVWDTSWTTTKTASYTYGGAGGVVVALEVRDSSGMTATVTDTVWVPPPAGAPDVTSIQPDTGLNNQSYAVTVGGSNFQIGAQMWLAKGSETIQAYNEVVQNSTSLDAMVDLTGASPGFYSVEVKNPDGGMDGLVDGFEVQDSGNPPPVVNSIDPANGLKGQTLTVDVYGAHFNQDAELTLELGAAVIPAYGEVVDPGGTWLEAGVDLAGASPGRYDVVVTNVGSGKSGRLVEGFQVSTSGSGSIVSWGRDDYGQVFDTPTTSDFVQVAAGSYHSLALKADGSIVSWGWNGWGQVSDTPTTSDFVQVAAGYGHSLALKSDGSIVSWGRDDYGQVSDTPTTSDFVQVAGGGWHSLALKSDGSIVAWGNDDSRQVSDTPATSDFVKVSSGAGSHSLALKVDGSIVSWGSNSYGQVSDTPTTSDFVQVAGGCWHSLALKSDGSIVAWGAVTDAPPGNDFVQVAASYHSLALKADGSIVAWGRNDYGQVSDTPKGNDFFQVAAGDYHSLALRH